MASTTNFNWSTPDDTSLVKDGAAAIRTLGQSIDTSMAELKGGTTGQVLSKTSNTDMDFTWVAQDDSNAIQNAIVDAKGDLIAASAADTPARLAVGNNGETLVADSSTSTGLRYQTSYNGNAVINGGMDFWQRSTSSSSNGYTTADRWYMNSSSTTFSQETSDVPTGFRYAMKCTLSGTATPSGILAIETQDSLRFANQTVVLSYYVKTSNSTNAQIRLDYSTNVDDSPTGTYTTISSTSVATTTSWTRVQQTFAVPSTAKTLRLVVGSNGNLTSGQTILFTGVQLEVGSIATTFKRAGKTIQGELAACQRYYTRTTGAASGDSIFVSGFAFSTTVAMFLLPLGTTMRVGPATMDLSNQGVYRPANGVTYSSGTWALNQRFDNCVRVIYTHGSAVFTAGESLFPSASGSTTFIGFSAEL